MGVIALVVPALGLLWGLAPLDIFNYVGTFAAFGFLVPYILITVAAPAYLAKLSQRRPLDVVICVVSLALLVIPTVGSVYPVPAAPVASFPYIFLIYLMTGITWILSVRRRKPEALAEIQQDLDLAHARHQVA